MVIPQYLPNCCYYPSTVLMVDDNQDLLSDLSLALSPHYKSKHSTSPREILTWLNQQGDTVQAFLKEFLSTPEEHYNATKKLVNIDIPALHQQIYAKLLRFDQNIVLVIDYAMPEMSGLELAKKIRRELKLPIKIIMLTGEADQFTAVLAFNEKLIDRFIVKSAPDYIETLLKYIQELHNEYFEEVSSFIVGSNTNGQKTIRNNPEFIKFFNEITQRHHIVEYYLIEEPASFLLLDEKKNPFWLIVKVDEDMQVLYELARDDLAGDNRDVSVNLVEALKKREKLVYFPDQKSKLASAKHWRSQNAKPLPGQQKIYYALIEGAKDYPLKTDKIVSYEQFLNS